MHLKIRITPTMVLIFMGVVGTIAGVAEDGQVDGSDVRSLSLGLVFVGLGWLATRHIKTPASVGYEMGQREGYADGLAAGRKIPRPVVVPMTNRCCGNCKRGASASAGNVATLGGAAATGRDGAALPTIDPSGPVDSQAWRGDGIG